MSAPSPTIFFSAAEASGDEHAALLISALRARLPRARLIGAGGTKMARAGCELLVDLTKSASMLSATFLKVPYYLRTLHRLKRTIRELAPQVHVPVDSPALNWHLASAAKAVGASVMYFIAPQVWAWAPWRVNKVRRLTDRVACILPFEQRYLRDRGVHASFVGHPLSDSLPPRPDPLPDLADAWANGTWRVALLPGSRPAEIRHHSRALWHAARAIQARWPDAQCTYCARTPESAEAIRKRLPQEESNIAIGRIHEVLAEAHFAIAASGTVTLEVAHFGVPMVVFYRASMLAYNLLARHLIRTPYLSLVNILGGRALVPELMPWSGNVRALRDMVVEMMEDLGCLFETRRALLDLTASLRPPPGRTAADTAADLVLDLLHS
jgi:lipid-A-disaccharide synthase